jgi:predicted lipoprotein with Yx(FWY)xxD motif
MLRSITSRGLAPAILLVAILGIACGDDDNGDGDNADTTPAATSAATRAASTPAAQDTPDGAGEGTPANRPPPPGAGETTILVGDGGVLGPILTTADGLTLYTFTNDAAGSGESACQGACANAWPPLTVAGQPTAPAEVTGDLATISRPDGTAQVTYNGLPLYRFVNDAAPGQTNGHAVQNVWFVASP